MTVMNNSPLRNPRWSFHSRLEYRYEQLNCGHRRFKVHLNDGGSLPVHSTSQLERSCSRTLSVVRLGAGGIEHISIVRRCSLRRTSSRAESIGLLTMLSVGSISTIVFLSLAMLAVSRSIRIAGRGPKEVLALPEEDVNARNSIRPRFGDGAFVYGAVVAVTARNGLSK
jgi:hypothetical protein